MDGQFALKSCNRFTRCRVSETRRPRGVRFHDESYLYTSMGNYFSMRIRVGAQRLGEGRYRLYVTQGMHLGFQRDVSGAKEFVQAMKAAAKETYGQWDADVQESIGAIERLCPRLAGELTRMLDLDPGDETPVLKGRPVSLLRRNRTQAFQLVRSDRGAWRLRIVEGKETTFVSKRIWSGADLGSVWHSLAPKELLPRLQFVLDRLAHRDPALAEAAFHLDRGWDEAPKVESECGLLMRPDWNDYVAASPGLETVEGRN